MRVTFKNVVSDIGLSTTEAEKLRGQIGALIEGMNLSAGATGKIPDFKDDRGTKREVKFKVLTNSGRDAEVDVTGIA